VDDWSQRSAAVGRLTDELRICFANIHASAQSLVVKLRGDYEAPIREDVEQIVQIAERMEKQLSCFSRAWVALTESGQTGRQNQTAAGPSSVFGDERLPNFSEYVRCRYGVDLEEDLVTMVEDLIERQKQKFSEKRK